ATDAPAVPARRTRHRAPGAPPCLGTAAGARSGQRRWSRTTGRFTWRDGHPDGPLDLRSHRSIARATALPRVIFALARRTVIDYHRGVHRFAIVIVLALATLSARADTPPQKPTLVVRIENADGDSAKLALALEGALRVASKSHYVHKPTDKQIQAVADGT